MLKNYIYELGGLKRCGFFTRNHYIVNNENFKEHREQYIKNCESTDVYQCIYGYENNEVDTCKIIADPYLDFDCEYIEKEEEYTKLVSEVLFTLRYIKLRMNLDDNISVYFSGSKGFHVTIPYNVLGITPSEKLNEELKMFSLGLIYARSNKNIENAKRSLIDTGIYDRKRLFRIPNTINSKSGLYKVPVTIDQLRSFKLEDMIAWAKEPHDIVDKRGRYNKIAREGYIGIVNLGYEYENLKNGNTRHRKHYIPLEGEVMELLPCAKKLLNSGAAKGVRNHSMFALSSSLFQNGKDLEEVMSMIENWNSLCEEPLGSKEIENTVYSALSSYDSGMIVGCTRYKDLNLCLPECPLLKGD